MADSQQDESARHEQHNHGSGTFIGRDNHGGIHFEMVDAKTKAILAKMSKDSPALAKLLAKALRDGVISPDAAEALGRAARNINEDVAHALWDAGRNINFDVADSLRLSSDNINPMVANQISKAADTLDEASKALSIDELKKLVYRIERTKESLNDAVRTLERLESGTGPFGRLDPITSALNGAAERIERVVTPPPPKIIINQKAVMKAFLWGAASGATLMVFVMAQLKGG